MERMVVSPYASLAEIEMKSVPLPREDHQLCADTFLADSEALNTHNTYMYQVLFYFYVCTTLPDDVIVFFITFTTSGY